MHVSYARSSSAQISVTNTSVTHKVAALKVAPIDASKAAQRGGSETTVTLSGARDQAQHPDRPSRRYGAGLAGKLVRRMDENRDGGVSLAEAQGSRYGHRISAEKFAHIDRNDDGQMSARELRSHFRQSLFERTDTTAPQQTDEAGSATSVAQIASQQALASISYASASISVASASYSETSGSFGGPVGDIDLPQTQIDAPAPREQSAAMRELAKIKAEQAAEAEAEAAALPDGDEVEIDSLSDLFDLMASGEILELDPLKVIEEVAELFGVEMDFGGPEETGDPMQVGALAATAGGSFAASEASLAAFSLEASLSTTTFADGSTVTAMSVNFTAISAYARTMEFNA
ncbi:hypothetical protein [Thalassobius sp. Cn5-15]|uniref:hypothetical protein n=1 Tax=Thalassobius sp. Cn5-15 TaxID=2917763 RepID=UPI001EF2DB8D|nr:hypothetical protein [Thalassobius sp. Cn5-15]MCG7494535.1 hypothetical protein [Thalassobius sp. Cn5-15]